jgi:REP element-mobilizing transposase RayT
MQQDDWLNELATALEPDGIRLLRHRFAQPGVSQFALSTQSHVAPLRIVQRVKGRLQHLVRHRMPKAWKGNYAIRGVGRVTRETIDHYVASQLDHHPMADPRVQERLKRFQVERSDVDLQIPQRTAHGVYWYNLHVVLVHRERWMEIREERLCAVRDMIFRSSDAKGYLLSRAAILSDHIHLVLGCPIDVPPLDVALGFLNNLAYAHGMLPVFQFGAFIGTVGEYTHHAMVAGTSPDGVKPRRGGGGIR